MFPLIQPPSSLTSSTDANLHSIASTVFQFYSSLLYTSYSTNFTMYSDTQNKGQLDIADYHHPSNYQRNSTSFPHRASTYRPFSFISTANPRNTAVAYTKFNTVSKSRAFQRISRRFYFFSTAYSWHDSFFRNPRNCLSLQF